MALSPWKIGRSKGDFMRRSWPAAFVLVLASLAAGAGWGQATVFGAGWTLDGAASSISFQSVKEQSTIETSTFAAISGGIDPGGTASVEVLLDSIDTGIDLRNVRMRFLFFETFEHPTAAITARIDPALIRDLPELRRKTIALPFTLSMHGVTRALEARVTATLIGDDLVAISTAEPITISVADFNLLPGLRKLEEAAKVSIVPSTTVGFDLIFRKDGGAGPAAPQVAATSEAPAAAALETQGDFSREECVGRFEILSRTSNIYFATGSPRLDEASVPLLDTVADIVGRCPGLNVLVAGHTDSVGSRASNQRLSERRARSVMSYLVSRGIAPARLRAVGFGEDRPVADNASREGRSRNRRIEFQVAAPP